MFFVEKSSDRTPIGNAAAVDAGLRLVSAGEGLKVLEDDYARIADAGLLLEDPDSFDALMARCADIVERANRVGE